MTGQRIQSFKYIPNSNHLKMNEESYLREDLVDLEAAIANAFSQDNGPIRVIPLTFFKTFINKQASLYTGDFERQGFKNNDKIDVDGLNNELKFTERYCHRDRRSLIYYFSEDDLIQFKAISALNYFKQGDYCFIQDTDEKVVLFHRGIVTEDAESQEDPLLSNPQDAGEIVNVYEITKIDDINKTDVNNNISMYDVVKNYNLLLEPLNQEMFTDKRTYKIEKTSDTYPVFPFSEVMYRDSKKAGRNYIAVTETRYVADMSFGIYQGEPKLVTHVVVAGDFDNKEDAKDITKDIGRRNKITIAPTNTDVRVFETGDLKVLKDMIEAFNGFISQQCQVNGVDFHALIPQSKIGGDVESGESKKLVMEYINEYRRDFYTDYQKLEREVFANIKKLWNIDNTGVKIVFQDLEPAETKKNRLDYAIAAGDNDLMTHDEQIAYTRKISLEDAQQLDIKGDVDNSGDDE